MKVFSALKDICLNQHFLLSRSKMKQLKVSLMCRMSWHETKTKEVWPLWLLHLKASLERAFMGSWLLCTIGSHSGNYQSCELEIMQSSLRQSGHQCTLFLRNDIQCKIFMIILHTTLGGIFVRTSQYCEFFLLVIFTSAHKRHEIVCFYYDYQVLDYFTRRGLDK